MAAGEAQAVGSTGGFQAAEHLQAAADCMGHIQDSLGTFTAEVGTSCFKLSLLRRMLLQLRKCKLTTTKQSACGGFSTAARWYYKIKLWDAALAAEGPGHPPLQAIDAGSQGGQQQPMAC